MSDDKCPFCGEKRGGTAVWSCGTIKQPDENGEYKTGVRCDRDCFQREVVRQAKQIARLTQELRQVQQNYESLVASLHDSLNEVLGVHEQFSGSLAAPAEGN